MCRIFYFFFDRGLFFFAKFRHDERPPCSSSKNTRKEIFTPPFYSTIKEERLRREARNALEDDEGEQFSSAFD